MGLEMSVYEVWLWRSRGLVGRLIRAQEWSSVNHAEIRFPTAYQTSRLDVGFKNGIRFTTKHRDITKGEEVWLYRFEAPESQVRAMRLRCAALHGRKYDRLGILRFLVPLRQALRLMGIGTLTKKRICSSAVEEVLRAGDSGWISPDVDVNRITPGDLFASPVKHQATGTMRMGFNKNGIPWTQFDYDRER